MTVIVTREHIDRGNHSNKGNPIALAINSILKPKYQASVDITHVHIFVRQKPWADSTHVARVPTGVGDALERLYDANQMDEMSFPCNIPLGLCMNNPWPYEERNKPIEGKARSRRKASHS